MKSTKKTPHLTEFYNIGIEEASNTSLIICVAIGTWTMERFKALQIVVFAPLFNVSNLHSVYKVLSNTRHSLIWKQSAVPQHILSSHWVEKYTLKPIYLEM